MTGIVFLSQAAADAAGTAYDVRLGYPRAGVDVGAGLHAPPATSATLRAADVLKHPTLPQWAYQESDEILSARAVVGLRGGVEQVLDATWLPTVLAVAIAKEEL